MDTFVNPLDDESVKSAINLSDIAKKTSEKFITDREAFIQELVAKLLFRMNGVMLDITHLKRELRKKEDKLVGMQKKFDQIKAGDWTVLQELEKEHKEPKKSDEEMA